MTFRIREFVHVEIIADLCTLIPRKADNNSNRNNNNYNNNYNNKLPHNRRNTKPSNNSTSNNSSKCQSLLFRPSPNIKKLSVLETLRLYRMS